MRRSLLLIACALWAPVAAAQAELDWAPFDPGGWIAFVDLDGRPALVNPATLEQRSVGLDALQRAQFPAWSRSGDALAIIVAELGGGRVLHLDVASGALQTLYQRRDRAPIYLGFAPDDATVAVLASRFTGPGLALDLVDVAAAGAAAGAPGGALGGAAEVETFAFGSPFYWDWIPASASTPTRLLLHQNVLGPQRRAGVSELGGFNLAVELPNPGAFQSPSVAPDGRHLAYASLVGDARSVVLLSYDAERNEAEILSRTPHQGVAALSWRPDGRALLVQSPPLPAPHSFGPLELIGLDGERRALSEESVLAAWWSPDGRFVATLSVVGSGAPRTVFGAAPSAEPERVVALEVERVQQGRAPLLALKLIDVDAGVTTPLSVLTPSLLFYGQQLPFFDQYSRSHRLWSPASDALVLPVLDESGVSTVVRFGIDGSVTPLAPGDMPAWNWR